MSVGLIPSLVGFLEVHLATLGEMNKCRCLPSADQPESEETKQGEEQAAGGEENNSDEQSSPTGKSSSPGDGNGADSESVPTGAVDSGPAASDMNERTTEGGAAVSTGPVFRITSPSYQAVQHELEQFFQLRESHAAAANAEIFAYLPGSPRSICLSPDRSPMSLSCGYSPERSLLGSPSSSGAGSPVYSPSPPASDYSPPASPPGSPRSMAYSPILAIRDPAGSQEEEEETFSDEFDSG